jgi:hypothetical protein
MGPVWVHSCWSSFCLGTHGHDRKLGSSVRVQFHSRRRSDFGVGGCHVDIRDISNIGVLSASTRLGEVFARAYVK